MQSFDRPPLRKFAAKDSILCPTNVRKGLSCFPSCLRLYLLIPRPPAVRANSRKAALRNTLSSAAAGPPRTTQYQKPGNPKKTQFVLLYHLHEQSQPNLADCPPDRASVWIRCAGGHGLDCKRPLAADFPPAWAGLGRGWDSPPMNLSEADLRAAKRRGTRTKKKGAVAKR